jgi:hypothetical protein
LRKSLAGVGSRQWWRVEHRETNFDGQ